MVRAGRRFVEEARWRIGGGERDDIVDKRREKREKGGGGHGSGWSMEVGTVASRLVRMLFRLPAIHSE
jgi:hypothetical protein